DGKSHAIFWEDNYKDLSCVICYQDFPEITGPHSSKYIPLQKWIKQERIGASYETYKRYDTAYFKVSKFRRRSIIYDIIVRCRFNNYPQNWDVTIYHFECYLKGIEPEYKPREYLPDLNRRELLEIYEGLRRELLNSHAQLPPITHITPWPYSSLNIQLETDETYTPLAGKGGGNPQHT
ncbi:1424_t:CDS:1, partial [Paraglomus occultum]